MLADSYGRIATDLRVSLTDRCNLRCAYCMPPEGLDWLPAPTLLTDDEVVRRLAGRRVCVKNPSHIYHVELDPPKHEGVCEQDGSRLIQRDDDREETIRRRLDVYHSQTEPLIGYYDRAGLLRRFDGRRDPNEVHAHIRATVATLRLEEKL